MFAIGIPLLFPILRDEDDFEDLCRDLLRTYWKRPGLERFGRKGQRQYGIDILDLGGVSPLHAAQCKLREYGTVLSPATISEEVGEARKFQPALGRYGILTTAKISTQAQTRILEINQAHIEEGSFEVELLAWDKLCELLQLNDEVREKFYGSIVITPTSRVGQTLIPNANELRPRASENSGSPISSQIDEARDALRRHDFQIALLLLNRILENSTAASLTDFEHFRISSNLGFVEVGLGRPEVAARHFLDALRWTPENQDARVNEVFAYILMGDKETAHAKAQALRAIYPDSTKLVSFWVRSAPRSAVVSDLETQLTAKESVDGEVALALARRALAELDLSKALRYARSAASAAPSSLQPQLVIAQAHFGRLIGVERAPGSPVVPRAELEKHVEEALTEALRLAESEHDERGRLEVVLMRSNFRLNQGRTDDAEKDALEAQRIDPDNVRVLIALAQIRSKIDVDGAIKLLERAHRISPLADVDYMYARMLLRRAEAPDIELAIALLSAVDVPSLPSPMKGIVATLAVQAMARKGDQGVAAAYLEPISEELEATLRDSLRGYIAHSEGDRTRAVHLAKRAQGEITPETAPETKEFLARLFMMLDQPDQALSFFLELFQLDFESFDAGQLLDCAAHLHRDDIVISTCATLQERGMAEWAVVSFEVQYLQKYSREKAIQRLDEFLLKHPEHQLARLTRSILGVQSQRPELVSGRVADLPPVEDLPLDYILNAVHVLRFSGAGNDGVDYAYRYLRLHFDDVRAHQALVLAGMPGDPSVNIPPTLDVVQADAAVSVQEELNGSIRWFVLEDTDHPDAQFEELSAASPLAAELLNKQVGDTVVVARGHMENRIATIRQIMPKYVRRFQDCMAEMQIRFGEASSIESMHVGTSEAEVRKSFEKIVESLKRRATAASQVRKLYDELPISLHMFGEQFGKNAFIGLISLAQEEGQRIKCTHGTSEERRDAVSALQTSTGVVVDITALATIRMTGLEDVLTKKRFRLQMTEGTWNELQETLGADLMGNVPGGTISYKDGSPRFTHETAEQKAARQDQDRSFLDRVKQSIEVVSVIELANLEPARREPLEKMFGQYGAESIMLASISDFVLWTDDLIQAQMAANEFGIRRAWTQLVVEQLAHSGEITHAEEDRVTATLIGFEYVNTNFDSRSLLRAIEMSEATPWHWPLKQFVEVFQKPSPAFRVLLGIFAEFLSRLYREPYLPESRCRVLTAFLDALWGNVSARMALLRLRRASSRFFVLNPIGQSQFDHCFDEWYRDRPDKLIVPSGY
jgi:tetratricopeptide (TPR) repeat protein